jgi:hypothetical protein
MNLGWILLLAAGTRVPVNPMSVVDEAGFRGAVAVVSEEWQDDLRVTLVRVPYLDVYGQEAEGLARLVVHRRQVDAGVAVPVFCHVHYEKDVGGAGHWARRGWAVSTAVYDEEHSIDAAVANGYNLSKAILQWVRRLPFIDRLRMHIDGGSQGGYMALAMSAEMFPVCATTADVPVVNWAYNLQYFEANKSAGRHPAPMEESPMPVMAAVTMLADWCARYYGPDFGAEAYYLMSPIAYTDRITCPVLVQAATGDMLVPMEQMRIERVPKVDPELFPEGYTRDFDVLTLNPRARVRFEECLPEGRVFVHWEPRQEHTFPWTLERFQDPSTMPERKPENIDRVWSRDHQWSLYYLDEGPALPEAPHSSYFWNTSPHGFVAASKASKPGPELLNQAKLTRLLERYRGRLSGLPRLVDGQEAVRVNFEALERRDVVQGLLDFVRCGPDFAAHLEHLYAMVGDPCLGQDLSTAALEALLSP